MAIKFSVKTVARPIKAKDLQENQLGRHADDTLYWKTSDGLVVVFSQSGWIIASSSFGEHKVTPLPAGTTITLTSEV